MPTKKATVPPPSPAISTDPRIDRYIENSAPFAQPILTHLRTLIHRTLPHAVEAIKWGRPFFTHPNGIILCNIAAFKEHASFGIWNSTATAELRQAGFHSEGAMGSLGRIVTLADLPTDKVLAHLLVLTCQSADEGNKPLAGRTPKGSRKALEMPPAFAAALKQNKLADTAYKAFSPSHQREYLEWIVEAKRDETRTKRIAAAIELLAEGKPRNWRYMAAAPK